jgi:hypothetical protein
LGGSSTTIGHNRQVTHLQTNNTFKQNNNKGHLSTMNTKQIRLTTTASTRVNTNTTRKNHNIQNTNKTSKTHAMKPRKVNLVGHVRWITILH